jgi:NDP-sugar pyrophosphorylase family protein
MQCVVLAGGLGTRMRPWTDTVPKILVPVLGIPFAAHQLELLAQQGYDDVVVCLGHRGNQVRDFVGDGRRFGVRVSYVDEGEQLRGTGGAMRLAHDRDALDETFAVVYGDSYLPTDPAPIWRAFRADPAPVLMTVYRSAIDPELNNVVFRYGRVVRYHKGDRAPEMDHIDWGLAIFERRVVDERIPPDVHVDLAAVYESLSGDGELAGYEVTDRYFEVGSPKGLSDLETWLRDRAATVPGVEAS